MRDLLNSLFGSKPEPPPCNDAPESAVRVAISRQQASADNLLATIGEFFDVNDEYRRKQRTSNDPAH